MCTCFIKKLFHNVFHKKNNHTKNEFTTQNGFNNGGPIQLYAGILMSFPVPESHLIPPKPTTYYCCATCPWTWPSLTHGKGCQRGCHARSIIKRERRVRERRSRHMQACKRAPSLTVSKFLASRDLERVLNPSPAKLPRSFGVRTDAPPSPY